MTTLRATLRAALFVAIAAWRPALAQEPPPPQTAPDSITPALVARRQRVPRQSRTGNVCRVPRRERRRCPRATAYQRDVAPQ